MGQNIHKLFYKDYYNGVDFNYIFHQDGEGAERTNINNRIKNAPLVLMEKPFEAVGGRNMIAFPARVLYPGLVTGVGLTHDSKKIKGGYNLGMHFDYVKGMPIIYGSSVKGVLRSYFKEFCENNNVEKGHIEELFEAIFNGCKKIDQDYKPMPVYERDFFFDAVIVQDYEGKILVDDSITPHGDNPLKNPIPIQMLKIAPGCVMEFRFVLGDSTVNGRTYTADDKLKIFKDILSTMGIGAKTNVGYGQLELVKNM